MNEFEKALDIVEGNGLDRVWSDGFGPNGTPETIGQWLDRQGVEQEHGKWAFYHATPKKGGATDSIRKGSYVTFEVKDAAHFAARDRGLGREDVVVYKLLLGPDDIDPGIHPTLRREIDLNSKDVEVVG